MYKLYGSPTSRAARIMWALEELGQPYEIVKAKAHSPEVLAVSAIGKVPVLTDGDFAVTDSMAIMLYLADKHGALTFPVGSQERARMMALIFFALDEIEGALWTLGKHAFKMLPEGVLCAEAIKPSCVYEFERAMKTLETLLGDGPFVMGETFTVADILLGHLGGWAKAMGMPTPPEKVAAYMERIRARPGWQAVAKARAAA